MAKSELIGYVRRSNAGSAIKICLLKEAIEKAKTITGKDGTEYISLIINAAKLRMIINGDEQEVTSVCQLTDEPPQDE